MGRQGMGLYGGEGGLGLGLEYSVPLEYNFFFFHRANDTTKQYMYVT